jgi:YesN/AraC family two-component response regulator
MKRSKVNQTLDFLHQKYGPSLTLEDLAEVLKRKPNGVRSVLSRDEDDWAKQINKKKIYIGRRVYFPAEAVAELLAGSLVKR